jgi:hypothetical protein
MTMSVWYKLDDGDPSQVKVEDGANVDDLKEAIKKKNENSLRLVDAPGLKVYASATTVPIPINTADIRNDTLVSSLAATFDAPLIVVAPKPQEQQQQQNGKLRCCSRIVVCFVFISLCWLNILVYSCIQFGCSITKILLFLILTNNSYSISLNPPTKVLRSPERRTSAKKMSYSHQ